MRAGTKRKLSARPNVYLRCIQILDMVTSIGAAAVAKVEEDVASPVSDFAKLTVTVARGSSLWGKQLWGKQ